VAPRTKLIAAVGGGVLVIAGVAFLILSGRAGDLPIPGIQDPPTCPLTGEEPRKESSLDRPAVALKIENAAVARPLSGLEKADLVYEELVEGGETRFMALYHCSDTGKGGPIRSARLVDPAIMKPKTMILGYSGANQTVTSALEEAGVISIDETNAGDAMERVVREGVSSEHTLYAESGAVRRLGAEQFDDPPPDDLFEFGDLQEGAKQASNIALNFGGASEITYEWTDGAWQRSQDGEAFMAESGTQIAPTNVLVEVHKIGLSEVVDVTGTPSPQIKDETGSGKAVLFRNGRAIVGKWERDSTDEATRFVTKNGDAMVFAPGSIWVELVPSETGEVEGSFDYER
jgi:hypothetical protein